MKFLMPLAGFALLGLALAGPRYAASGAEGGAEVSDVQDIIYLRGSKPILLRMHVQIDESGRDITIIDVDNIRIFGQHRREIENLFDAIATDDHRPLGDAVG